MSRVAVIGAGAWGTALAIVLGRQGTHQVCLWAYEDEVSRSIMDRRTNDLFLPGCPIPAAVEVTSDLHAALRDAQIVLSVMPSHHARQLFREIANHLTPET